MSLPPIKVGISACLLGEMVRYDGQHKLDRYLRDTLGKYVQWIPVCPEVGCGLSIPREAMRLVGSSSEEARLTTVRSGIDHTLRMLDWTQEELARLAPQELCGFVFKTKSPSSAMRDAKLYTEKGHPSQSGPGLFAREFMKSFPDIPVEDDGRLHDAGLRENFIERVFVFARWKQFYSGRRMAREFIEFHTIHKLLYMAHSPKHYSALGKLVAGVKKKPSDALLEDYFHTMMDCLRLIATVKKHVNVLYHAMGYFKTNLSAEEKRELREIIEEYQKELVPLIVPVVLFRHYTRKYAQEYLEKQVYFYPHPDELKLRNHV